jgi:hypothetical protein
MNPPRSLGLLALLALTGAGLLGAAAQRPSADDPFARFDHEQHRTGYLESKVTCQACHPIGLVTGTDDFTAVKKVDELVLTPARGICHDCHTGELRFPRAPTRCTTCHQDLAPLIPEDHEIGWERDHGWASLRHHSSCELCHTVGYCETCHAQRDERRATVHPATFRSTHGVEARLDPGRCQRCHLQSSCEACHSGKGLP